MKIISSEIVDTKDYRVVIFPASRAMTAKEIKEVSERLFDFLASWQSHGKPLDSSFKILNKQFFIITIDEDSTKAHGCSLDELNGFFRKIETEFSLGLFERMKACYQENGEVKTLPLSEFKQKICAGEISKDIEVFDFSKNTFVEFLDGFLLPFNKSWARFIKVS